MCGCWADTLTGTALYTAISSFEPPHVSSRAKVLLPDRLVTLSLTLLKKSILAVVLLLILNAGLLLAFYGLDLRYETTQTFKQTGLSFDSRSAWSCPVSVDGLALGSQAVIHRLRAGPMRIIALIDDQGVIRRILEYLGHRSPARGPFTYQIIVDSTVSTPKTLTIKAK